MRFKIILIKNKNRKWFWKLLGRNGRIMAHSEEYSSKTKASKTATLLFNNIKNCVLVDQVKI